MVNVLYGDLKCEILPKQLETFDKYSKILQWGRQNPTRFIEQFIGIQLTDYQKYVILSSWVPANVVWVCSRSSGKCTVLDTPVYCVTKDRGFDKEKYPRKTVRDLKIGDYIIGDDGKPTEVIHLNPIVIEDVYEIEFEDGEIIECNAEHLWIVNDRDYDKRHPDLNRFVIRNTDFIYNHFSDRFGEKNKDYRFHVPLTKPVEYADYGHFPINPYLLGVWLGDGYSASPCIATSKNDGPEMRDNLKPYATYVEFVKVNRSDAEKYEIIIDREKELKENGYTRIHPLIKKIRDLGLYNNKHIPDRYLFASVENRLSLLQGLMDTDGTIGTNGKCEFTQTNKKLAEQVCWLIRSLGMDATLSYKEHTNYIKKDGTEADTWRVYFTASKELPVFRLKRKYDRLPEHPIRGGDRKAIVDVRKTGRKKAMRCITVNNESGGYLTGNNFTVTHNSFMSAPLIMARSLLIPSHNTYIMGPTGSQSQETFTKLENLAKNNIASVVGVTSFFLDECVRINSKADPFTHDKSGYTVELYNGSTINTLNSVAKNVVGIRSSLNIYDEAGKIDRDFYALTLPFTVQNADFRLGGTLNTEIYPRQLQNKNLLCSSAEGIDSELYDRYKIAFTKMMMGDPEYFVCDLDCTHSLHPFLNGKPTKPLITQQTIDDAYNTNPYRCMREYWNKFDNDLTKSALCESIKCISLNCQKALRVLYTTT